MPSFLVPALFFLALTALISWAGYRYYARPGRFYEQLGTVTVTDTFSQSGGLAPGLAIRIIKQVGERVPVSPDDVTLTRRLLIAAGHREDHHVAVYYGFRVVALLAAGLLAFVLQSYLENGSLRIVTFVVAGVAGFFFPGLFLEHLVDKRQEVLRLSLPDALDLMVVCVEAGLGLDQAINVVSRELALSHPEICDELGLINLEIRGGKRRTEALRNLADRTGEPEIRKLVSILVQTDRFGTSIADSLRTHSDFMRIRRRQLAEERAGKVGVKLVFPIFFCILPAMLVVVAGPGVLQIFKQLFPLMQQFTESQGG
jgi:tight adherence protein C